MERSTLTHYVTLLIVLAVACALAALTTRGELDPTLPVPQGLPDTLGACQGTQMLYCHQRECLTSIPKPAGTNDVMCPLCGAKMEPIALGEKELLPADTRISRRRYTGPGNRQYTVSVVTGGYERRSIHKPQVCLVAQGNVITRQYPIPVTMHNGHTVDVTIMEMNGGGFVFAYWFTDGTRETASHLKRLFWIAWDGVVHNTRRRWAYISVVTKANLTSNRDAFEDFLRDVYDAIADVPTADH